MLSWKYVILNVIFFISLFSFVSVFVHFGYIFLWKSWLRNLVVLDFIYKTENLYASKVFAYQEPETKLKLLGGSSCKLVGDQAFTTAQLKFNFHLKKFFEHGANFSKKARNYIKLQRGGD